MSQHRLAREGRPPPRHCASTSRNGRRSPRSRRSVIADRAVRGQNPRPRRAGRWRRGCDRPPDRGPARFSASTCTAPPESEGPTTRVRVRTSTPERLQAPGDRTNQARRRKPAGYDPPPRSPSPWCQAWRMPSRVRGRYSPRHHDQPLGISLERQGFGRGDDAAPERQGGQGRRHRAPSPARRALPGRSVGPYRSRPDRGLSGRPLRRGPARS